MSAAQDEREIAERIVTWLAGEHTRGTTGVHTSAPACFVCGSRPIYAATDARADLVAAIEEIISEGLHS